MESTQRLDIFSFSCINFPFSFALVGNYKETKPLMLYVPFLIVLVKRYYKKLSFNPPPTPVLSFMTTQTRANVMLGNITLSLLFV